MEDYKKKYEEALETARKINSGEGVAAPKGWSMLEVIFPELKENEESKIIDALKNAVLLHCSLDHKYVNTIPKSHLIAWLEKQGKQGSDSKVKPKFTVGDWITFHGSPAFKILKIEAEDNGILDYLLLNQNGHDSFYNKEYVDKNARLWTIQDAKKGDILQANKCTLIFNSLAKDIDGNTVISSWYYCDTKAFYGIGTCKPDLWVIEGVTPATKEQRDLLFQKIEEAGYEWDNNKKELIKHGQ